MSHILMSGISKLYQLFSNVDFGAFMHEKWYLDNFLEFTHTYTDVECGTFDNDIVDADYGSF